MMACAAMSLDGRLNNPPERGCALDSSATSPCRGILR
jgi:hypothetical protein